jgi:hypothetical protein
MDATAATPTDLPQTPTYKSPLISSSKDANTRQPACLPSTQRQYIHMTTVFTIADSDAHSASTFCARRRHRAITFKNTTRNATNVPSSRGAHASPTPQYCAKTCSWTPHWTCSYCPALTVRRHQRRSHKWALLDGETDRPPGSSLEGSSAV